MVDRKWFFGEEEWKARVDDDDDDNDDRCGGGGGGECGGKEVTVM